MSRHAHFHQSPGVRLVCLATLLFLVAPMLIVIPLSFGHSSLMTFPPDAYSLRWYTALTSDRRWYDSARNSLIIAAVVALLTTPLATVCALGMHQGQDTCRLRSWLMPLILSPLAVPTIITGVSLYYLFSLLKLNGTAAALILGHVILTFPYGVVIISAALDRLDPRLEQAAANLGASPLRTFFHVTLPIITPSILITVIFSLLISFDEVVIALLLSGPQLLTVPKMMWDGIRFDLTPVIASVSCLLLLASTFIVVLVELLRARSLTSGHKGTEHHA